MSEYQTRIEGDSCTSPYHDFTRCPRCIEEEKYRDVYQCLVCGGYFDEEGKEYPAPEYASVGSGMCGRCDIELNE